MKGWMTVCCAVVVGICMVSMLMGPPLDLKASHIDVTPAKFVTVQNLPFLAHEYTGSIRNGYSQGDDCNVRFKRYGETVQAIFTYSDSNFSAGKLTTGVFTIDSYDPSKRTAVGSWHDRYGNGPMEMTFDSNFDSFTGAWGESGTKARHKWSGRISAET